MSRGLGRTGSNAGRVRSYNQAVVLEMIRRADGISRVEIAQETGLAPQTVTNICNRLLTQGIIEEGEKLASSLGKPRTALRPMPGGLVAVGIQFDPDFSRAVLLDLGGTVRLHRDFTPSPGSGTYEVLETIMEASRELVDASEIEPSRILGLGVGAPGPLDLERGMLLEPPHLPNWHDTPVREILEQGTGLPVVLDKDVTAAAVAASWYREQQQGITVAVIYVGTGIGLGVFMGSEVLRGSSGNAGEVGHLVVDSNGYPCTCGMRGCLGVTSSPASLVERILPEHKRVVSGMAKLVAGAPFNPDWDNALQRAADGLAQLARTVARLYDTNQILFGGPMWPYFESRLTAERLRDLSQSLSRESTHPVECRVSDLGVNLGAVGAASLVFNHFLSPRASQLVLRPDSLD